MQRRKDNKGRVLKDGEVYRKSDGLYMYRWTAKNGKRHTIYDATLEGLREKEEKIQHDLADGLRIPECSLTLNDLFELWRKNKVGLKEHTFANYVYMYNRFVRDEIGMMKLKDIRKSDIRSYYNGIVRNGKMALNTLETIQNVLHQVFAVAVDDEYIRVNPTDGVLTAIKAAHQYETPKRHALTLPQQQAFLNFIKKTPKFQHWLPMFTFMLGTGCRISETVGLCWGDIDFESGFITIQHNLVYHDHEVGGCYFTMSTPKTAAGKRAIPILPEVRKALEQERTNQQELELVCEYEIDGISDFVFLNRFGQPQNPQTVFLKMTVREDYEELAKVLGCKKSELKDKIQAVAQQLEITHLLERHPYDLSGGEQQRAAIGKVLLLEPRLLLLDEPTKGIDAWSKRQLGNLLKDLRGQGITVLMVTHDVEFAAEVSDRCGLFFDHEITSVDTPEEFFCNNNYYTTAANRISRQQYENAITCEEVIELCRQNGRKSIR